MQTDNSFLEKRLNNAAFNFWLYQKEKEKCCSSPTVQLLAEEYSKKYKRLLCEYACDNADLSESTKSIWTGSSDCL